MYFAIYQALAKDERRPGVYREYARDFFDLIIVDECHRGSARDESNWREILEYFEPAFQLGMTATPLREDNRDTYRYFHNPLYIYSLRQGIDDGFLAHYRVHRIVSTVDAAGWRPTPGELDRYGREIPDSVYGTADFDRLIALKARTEAIARNLTDFVKKSDRFGKTIVFCVDQEHAEEIAPGFEQLQRGSREAISRLRGASCFRRGRYRPFTSQPFHGAGNHHACDPYNVADAHYRS
jgi:type I restriction enzyme R subunit